MQLDTLAERLKVRSKPMPNGCIEFDGGKARGYGRIWLGRENGRKYFLMAHRVAWTLRHGEIPDGMLVLHSCDNPSCVNVDHLSLGTQTDNMRDMYSKGRKVNPKGAAHWRSKLTPELVKQIREDQRSARMLSKEIGVSFSLIAMVRRGVHGDTFA